MLTYDGPDRANQSQQAVWKHKFIHTILLETTKSSNKNEKLRNDFLGLKMLKLGESWVFKDICSGTLMFSDK